MTLTNFPAPVLAEPREGALPSAPLETQRQARESKQVTQPKPAIYERKRVALADSRGGETSFWATTADEAREWDINDQDA